MERRKEQEALRYQTKVASVEMLISRYNTPVDEAREKIGLRKTDLFNVLYISSYRKRK